MIQIDVDKGEDDSVEDQDVQIVLWHVQVEDEEVELCMMELQDDVMQVQFVQCIGVLKEVAIIDVEEEG